MKPLIDEAMEKITTENWRNAVKHAEQIQADDAEMWQLTISLILSLSLSPLLMRRNYSNFLHAVREEE